MSSMLDGKCKHCGNSGWILMLQAATGKDACQCPALDDGEHEFIWPIAKAKGVQNG